MMQKDGSMLIDGEWIRGEGREIEVRSPYTGKTIGIIHEARDGEIEKAISSATRTFKTKRLTPYERYEILSRTSDLIRKNKDALARTIAEEAGKPVKDARVEVDRAIQTFLISAEEAKRIHGEGIPVEASRGAENRMAFTIRVPIGPVCAISPFNFPLNLVAHKVGPAIAAGNTVVLKPSSYTPFTAIHLGRLLMEAGLPPGFLNIIFGPGSTVGEALLKDERFALYSFTGSPAVGKRIREKIGLRKAILELGSNSATIVHEDANLDKAVSACVRAGFAYAGQVCISLQRLFLHEDIEETFMEKFIPPVESLKRGDPLNDATDIGPMITREAADRAMDWINEAVKGGATILTGGKREGNIVYPTVLKNVQKDMKVVCYEAFAPVVTIHTYRRIEDAIEEINDSVYGLQAGIFTHDINVAFKVARGVQVGGVMVNDTSMYRADQMPYGGVKGSGMGREGPSYAIEEMTELRIIVFNLE